MTMYSAVYGSSLARRARASPSSASVWLMHSQGAILKATTCVSSLHRPTLAQVLTAGQYHSKENVSKMRAKIPLNDNDRWAWLERLASACCDTASEQHDVLLSCSALQRNYRTTLRAAISSKDPSAVSRFIYLRVPSEVAAQRAAQRTGHYMPAAMVASQYDTLEEPDAGLEPDDVIWIDATASAEVTVARALREVRLRSS